MYPDKAYSERNYEVGGRLLGLRTRARLTQAQLAKLVEVSSRSVEKWETGEVYPSEQRVRKLVEVLLEAGAFLASKELEEAQAFWELVSQNAPRRLSPFDENWIRQLLSTRQVKLAIPIVTNTNPTNSQNLTENPTSDPNLALSNSANLPLPIAKAADWGEAPSVRNFAGRQSELAELESWITSAEDCRVVALLGMGGIGKTSLSIKLGQQLTPHFDYILWRSLRSAPPLNEILETALRFLSGQTLTTSPGSLNEGISQLIQLMRQQRCLLVLDNLEAILQEEAEAGSWREGYTDYGLLLRRLAESEHQSCLVITSREKPRELSALEGYNSPVRTMRLSGLGENEFQEILGDRGLVGDTTEWAGLAQRYGGNPLALKLVSETVRETFGGEIKAFLATDTVVFGDVGYLLDSQFERLTKLERDLMFWLAIEREPVGLATLEGNLSVKPTSRRSLLEALESLRRRNLLERSATGNEFTQQPVVMEYVTAHLIERVHSEIADFTSPTNGNLFLTKYALLKAQTRDYVRHSQERLIIQPLLARLKAPQNDSGKVEAYIKQTLERVRSLPQAQQGYAGGNLLNLLVGLGSDLQGWDFSGLNLWQSYLAGVELRNVNMAGADLSRSTFMQGFNFIVSLGYSPDGQFLAGGSVTGDIKVWQLGAQAESAGYILHQECRGHTEMVISVAYSPNGRLLASGSHDHSIRLWDAQSGNNLLVLQGHTDRVSCVAFSPDGKLLASGSYDGTIRLWRIATGETLMTLEGHTSWVWTVAYSPDGRMVASGSYDGTIRLWEISKSDNSYNLKAILNGHEGWVSMVVFSEDAQTLYSCGADSTIKVWSVANHQLLRTLRGHVGGVQTIGISLDGTRLVSGGADRTAQLWHKGSDESYLVLSGHTGALLEVVFSPDGTTVASTSNDRTIRLWSVERGETLATLQGHSKTIMSLAVSPTGAYLASTSSNNQILLWKLNHEISPAPAPITPSSILKGHTNLIFAVSFNPEGDSLASAGQEGVIRIWDLDRSNQSFQSQPRLTLSGHTMPINGIAFDSTGRLLASASVDSTIKLWSTINGELIASLEESAGPVSTVAFSPDGNLLASGGNDGTVILWDTITYHPINTLTTENIPIAKLAYHPAGHLLACAKYDGTILLWQTADYTQPPVILKGHKGTVWSVAFSPDPATTVNLLSGGNDGTVRLWNTENGAELASFQHGGLVRSVAFSPDGKKAVSAGGNGLVKLWDIASGELVATYRDFEPYEGVNITGAIGLTGAQRATLMELGAVES